MLISSLLRYRSMASKHKLVFFSILLSLFYETISICNKTPEGVMKPKNRNVNGRYIIEIPGNPKTYTPGQKYNIYLKADPKIFPQKAFIKFILTLEPDEEDDNNSLGQLNFEHDTEILARISTICPNTVIESSSVPKTEIQVYWTAPPPGSGCVNIKASIVESRDNWFSEDEGLSKRLCEESLQDENVQPEILKSCCACDEAKYEIAFEGKWTRNTHPRHFPMNQWKTKFSDLIGASHQLNHSFWEYEDTASEGLKELATSGITKALESELKNDSEHLRTIIKARGLQYPNITKSTYAVFRVDKRNHLVSLAAKIIPSPDWIVGISNLELCKADCTWDETRVLNLYPWDVGIDNGLQYDSLEPASTLQPIRRITPNNPNDPRSPFYNTEGEEMKPIAKLYITRQRLYTKTCELGAEHKPDCSNDKWLNWTTCSASCGKGIKVRQRAFMDEATARDCGLNFIEHKVCLKRRCISNANESDKEETTENTDTIESTTISSEIDKNSEGEEDPNCLGFFWSPWTPCSASCGSGTRKRIRIRKQNSDNDDNGCLSPYKEETCNEMPCDDKASSSNSFSNMEASSSILIKEPVGEVIDCKVSKWSPWSKCISQDPETTCGKGYRFKVRQIKVHQANGGKECPRNLRQIEICNLPCSRLQKLTECEMGDWSNWTPCSANCGSSAIQIRTREIIHKPPAVDTCPPRIEKKSCRLPLACRENGEPILNK